MRLSDAELLDRYVARREASAFEAILERHGPMVLGVCRRLLRDEHAAEDALQVTFLVLARSAANVRKQSSLASWLYGVALKVAHRQRELATHREERETKAATPELRRSDPLTSLVWQEVKLHLDQALGELPDKYRAPLILCYLEGKSHGDAAQELRWSRGSMFRRLEKARELLRDRLVRRGVALSTGMLFGVLEAQPAQASVPGHLTQPLLDAVTRHALGKPVAAGVLSTHVLALTEEVLRTMLFSRFPIGVAVLVTLGLLGGGVGLVAHQVVGQETGGTNTAFVAQDTPPKTAGTGNQEGGGGVATAKASEKANATEKPLMTNRDVRRRLATRSPAFKEGVESNFAQILQALAETHDLPIRVDYAALARANGADASQFDEMQIRLKPTRDPSLAHVLQQVVSQLGVEATYVVKGGQVVIEPPNQVQGGEGGESLASPALRVQVELSVDERPLSEALKELAEATGANIIIDTRLKDKAKVPVTATLQHVPLETAVRLLADMAQVEALSVDNVLYVTTPENAERWRKAEWQKLYGIQPGAGSGAGLLGGPGTGGPGFTGGMPAGGGDGAKKQSP